ncbi:hypothetical protein Tco_0157478 [Tanacetum coccineum]
MSPINDFSVEELYSPQFSDSFQENTGYWQEPNPYESPVEQVANSPPNKKKSARARQKRMIQSNDAPRQIAWATGEEIALAKGFKLGCFSIVSDSSGDNSRLLALKLFYFE